MKEILRKEWGNFRENGGKIKGKAELNIYEANLLTENIIVPVS